MTKQNHKTGFLVAGMVFCAILLRVLGKFDILIVPGGTDTMNKVDDTATNGLAKYTRLADETEEKIK